MTTRAQVAADMAAIRDRRPTDAALRRKQIDDDVARFRLSRRPGTPERVGAPSGPRPAPGRPMPKRPTEESTLERAQAAEKKRCEDAVALALAQRRGGRR